MTLLSERITEAIHGWETDNNQKLSNTELAKVCNVSKQTVGDWRKGRTQTMTGEALLNGADFFNVDPRWLCSGTGKKQKYLVDTGYSSPSEPPAQSNYNDDAIDFAVLGIIEFTKAYPKTMSDEVWRKKAFKILCKAWYNEDMKNMGAAPLLRLVT